MDKRLPWVLLMLAFGLNHAMAQHIPGPGVLAPLGTLHTRQTFYTLNPQMHGLSVAQGLAGTYWWAGLDSLQEYNGTMLGNLFIEKIAVPVGGATQVPVSKVYRGKVHVIKLLHLGQGRGLAMLMSYKDNVSFSGHDVAPVDLVGTNYALAWLSEAGDFTRIKPLVLNGQMVSGTGGFCTDNVGNVYVSMNKYPSSYIRKYALNGDSVLQIKNHNVPYTSNLYASQAGDIVALGSCVDPGATFGGMALSDSLFDYTTFIAGYTPQGAGRWMHTTHHITCPSERLLNLEGAGMGGDVAWMGTRVLGMRVAGQALPHPSTFYNGMYCAIFDPITGVMRSLTSGPDAITAGSLDLGGGAVATSLQQAGTGLAVSGRPTLEGQAFYDSTFRLPARGRAQMALPMSRVQGPFVGDIPKPLFLSSNTLQGTASCLGGDMTSLEGGILAGLVNNADTIYIHNGNRIMRVVPVADGPGYTAYLQPYVLELPVAVKPQKQTVFTVYPNPATSQVRWQVGLSGSANATVRSSTGAVVCSQSLAKGSLYLSLPSLPAGIYTLTLHQGAQIHHARFVRR